MFHHDPAVMLYAPLRTAIYQDAQGRTRFSVDQPSTQFTSFGNPEITKVGFELDGKLAALAAPPEGAGAAGTGSHNQQSTNLGYAQ